MFKTSQPNSDRPSDDRTAGQNRNSDNQTDPQFKTLDEFSDWIDAQLLIVESKHDGFQTSESVRKFFSRG